MDENKIYLMHHPIYRWDRVVFAYFTIVFSVFDEAILFTIILQLNETI